MDFPTSGWNNPYVFIESAVLGKEVDRSSAKQVAQEFYGDFDFTQLDKKLKGEEEDSPPCVFQPIELNNGVAPKE